MSATERTTALKLKIAEKTEDTVLSCKKFESESKDDELEEEDSLSSEDEIHDELLPEVANSGFNFPDIRENLCTSAEETLSRLSVSDSDTDIETQTQASLARKMSDFLEKVIRQKEKFISHLSNILEACYETILSSLASTDGPRPCKQSQLFQTEKLFV